MHRLVLALNVLDACCIYASVNRVSISSINGLSPIRRQDITWTNADLLSFETLRTNFSEILIAILIFSFKKMCLKLSSAKVRAFCSGGDELMHITLGLLCSLYQATYIIWHIAIHTKLNAPSQTDMFIFDVKLMSWTFAKCCITTG